MEGCERSLCVKYSIVDIVILDSSNTETLLVTETIQEALDILKRHEIEHTLRYSAYYSEKGFGETGEQINNAINFRCNLSH